MHHANPISSRQLRNPQTDTHLAPYITSKAARIDPGRRFHFKERTMAGKTNTQNHVLLFIILIHLDRRDNVELVIVKNEIIYLMDA
jgi:hypothetical protein